jgi:hypothetical protein
VHSLEYTDEKKKLLAIVVDTTEETRTRRLAVIVHVDRVRLRL